MAWDRYRGFGGFPPYVPVAERKRQAAREIAILKKKRKVVNPIILEGKTIAKTFWGKAWCDNLESYSDYANRLERGRTYVRNGSVIDLQVQQGVIHALVSGSSIYEVHIRITALPKKKWNNIVTECSGKIDSLIELLQGKFSKGVMEIITHPKNGLFPHPNEIDLACSCPDWAEMCKHVAAVLYGIGSRLDERPEELFLLRHTDHLKLIAKAGTTKLVATKHSTPTLADTDLSTLFGIDIEQSYQNDAKLNKVVNKKIPTSKKKASHSPKRKSNKPKQAAKKAKT